jgi:hypothetical protein
MCGHQNSRLIVVDGSLNGLDCSCSCISLSPPSLVEESVRRQSTVSSPKKRCLVVKKKQHIKHQKAVRFSPCLTKIHICQASSNDRMKSWHTNEEYREIKVKALKTILEARRTRNDDGNIQPQSLLNRLLQTTRDNMVMSSGEECSIRGLESNMSQQIRDLRRQWVGNTVKGVLCLQESQKNAGLSDPDQLRVASASASQLSALWALLFGAVDAEESASNTPNGEGRNPVIRR